MGFSYIHSTTTALVLNMKTNSIYPQFHVVFGDEFTPIHSSEKYPPLIWDRFIISDSSKFQTSVEDTYSGLADEWFKSGYQEARENQHQIDVINIGRVQDPDIPTDGNEEDSINIMLS